MEKRTPAISVLSVFTAVVGSASLLVGIANGSILSLAVGVSQFVAAYGLWTLQPWGSVLAGVVYAFDGLRKANQAITGEPTAVGGLVVNAAIVAYLYANRELFTGKN